MEGVGPDWVVPTEELVTWDRDGSVKIRKVPEYPGNREPMSLVTFTTKQCKVFAFFIQHIITLRDFSLMNPFTLIHTKLTVLLTNLHMVSQKS